jgi:hypothetical protein
LRAAAGVGIFTAVTVSTAVYYLAVMAFTGLTYIFIRPRSYLTGFLILTLIYVAVLAGLFISGTNNRRDIQRRQAEKSRSLDVAMLLQALGRDLAKTAAAAPDGGRAVMDSFKAMQERLGASTPFGRSDKPAVVSMENQIVTKLRAIGAQASSAGGAGDGAFFESLAAQLGEAKTMIMDREKLMFV